MLPIVRFTRRSVALAAVSLLALAAAGTAQAATPKDTLVVALAFDDIITLDPAEAFEISAGEIMGNVYERLVRFDLNDPSKLVGGPGQGLDGQSADGKTFSFELKPKPGVCLRQPAHGRGRGLWSLQRAVLLDKNAGLHPQPVRLHQGQRQGPHPQATGALTLTLDHRQGLCALALC